MRYISNNALIVLLPWRRDKSKTFSVAAVRKCTVGCNTGVCVSVCVCVCVQEPPKKVEILEKDGGGKRLQVPGRPNQVRPGGLVLLLPIGTEVPEGFE